MRRSSSLVAALSVLALAVVVASAQTKRLEPDSDSIVGVVIGPDGKPVGDATIQQWSNRGSEKAIAADEDGHFVVSGLGRSAYRLSASSADLVFDEVDGTYYHTGESVTLKLAKGGVITGRVTEHDGDPMVAINVRAVRIKDAAGKSVSVNRWGAFDTTDDRGVYRIYGLTAGTYLVVAGHAQGMGWGRVSSHDDDSPTYYPSSTRETASTVVVSAGQEVTGIDISFRGDVSHSVTARVVGDTPNVNSWVSTSLTRPGDAEELFASEMSSKDATQQLTISGVADGEYEISAMRSTQDGSEAFYSTPKRVSVHGADVGGLTIELLPFSSIAGKVIVEKPPPSSESCERPRSGAITEVVITAEKARGTERDWDSSTDTVDESGAFKLGRIKPGIYHLGWSLPDARWYVRDVARGDPAKASKSTPASDIALAGIPIAQRQRPDDIRVFVADGAASLAGRVKAATEGGALPSALRVYLIPATDEQSTDRVRYASAWTLPDGSFKLEHLAPGSYFAVVRSEPLDDTGDAPEPAYWDAAARAKLRKDAAAEKPIDLAKCQDSVGVELVAAAPPAAHRPGRH